MPEVKEWNLKEKHQVLEAKLRSIEVKICNTKSIQMIQNRHITK